MSVINAVAQLLAAGGDYLISRSVRLRSSASAYLSKTFGSAGNRKKWTYSAWIKRGALGTYGALIASKVDGNNYSSLEFSGDELRFVQASGGSITVNKKPAGIFRDPSAWYHIVAVMDTDNATAEDRFILYKNGERVTVWASNTPPALGLATGYINSTTAQWIGLDANPLYFDGYLTEINFIDGQALTASSFGEIDAITGVWKPKKYAGTYGTNGFKLDFSDPSAATAAAIGKDSSGNGNNWTPNNISVTAGATYDSMLDTPTPYADGGNGRGNYCVLNPLNCRSGMVISSGNLQFQGGSAAEHICIGSMDIPAGTKIYYEMTIVTAAGSPNNSQVGIVPAGLSTSGYIGNSSGRGYGIEQNQTSDYRLRLNGADAIISNTPTSGDVLQVAVDMVNGKIWLGKNNTWYNSTGSATGDPSAGTNESATISTTTVWQPAVEKYNTGGSYVINFGQRPFAYTPPAGFKALNTQNLPDATIKKGNAYFDVSTYAGTGATQSITNNGAMQPDFVWIKSRNNASNHLAIDAVRGGGKILITELADAEYTGTYLSSFNSNGFTIGATASSALNASGYTYVGWQWKAGGAAVTNNDGSIASQVSANVSAGFSVVTYTLNNSTFTVGHGLGVAPKMIIVKNRDAANNWDVYHHSVGAGYRIQLNATAAPNASTQVWNNTAPTSTVFSGNSAWWSNPSTAKMVAYCFAEVAGYSKFGSYTGNGSTDGPFVYCGFRPKFIMWKRTDSTGDWSIMDTGRWTYNGCYADLNPNNSDAEGADAYNFDILSNGFKVRQTYTAQNASGGTYIFMALAESPFKNSLAR